MQKVNNIASQININNQAMFIRTLPPPPLDIPSIQEDELLMGYTNRLREMNGIDEPLLKKILRNHYESLNTSNQELFYLDFISRLVNMELDEFIEKHTMSPESRTFESLYKNRTVNPYSISFIFKRAAKFCPVCSNHEHTKLGVSYWHRWHQIRGVYMCDLHDTPLLIGESLTPFECQPHNLLKKRRFREQVINFGKQNAQIIKYLVLAKAFIANKNCINFVDLIDKLIEKDLEINGYPRTKHNQKPLSRLIVRAYPKQWLSDHFQIFNSLGPSKSTIKLDAIVKLKRYDGPLIQYLIYFAYLFDVSEVLD